MEGLFTGLPPFNMRSVSPVRYTTRRTHKKHAQHVQKYHFASITSQENSLGSGATKLTLPDGKALA